jgi:AcrR family transcriptional regulator
LSNSVKGHSRPASAKETAAGAQTRDQILAVASNLFATQGYHGTTTREIADGVGIRQPSLFHHFESKAAIMQSLLEDDLGKTVADREQLARSAEDPGVRLYRYVLREVRHIATSRYNVAGIYSEEVRTSHDLAPWYARRRRLHRAIDRIVRDGQRNGEFVNFPVELVRAAVLGTLERGLTGYSGGQAEFNPALAEHLANLLVRSVLRDPVRVDEIRETVRQSEDVSQISPVMSSEDAGGSGAPCISDASWAVIAAAVPERTRARGGRWRNDRQVMEAIAWRFVNKAAWRDLPQALGPWQTAWKRYARWVNDGTWQRMLSLAEHDPLTQRELIWMRGDQVQLVD